MSLDPLNPPDEITLEKMVDAAKRMQLEGNWKNSRPRSADLIQLPARPNPGDIQDMHRYIYEVERAFYQVNQYITQHEHWIKANDSRFRGLSQPSYNGGGGFATADTLAKMYNIFESAINVLHKENKDLKDEVAGLTANLLEAGLNV